MEQDLTNELKRLRDERQKKFNEEDWEGALEIHDRILELSPSALRYANRGSILYRLGQLEEAVGSYRKALEMDPSLKRARADLERLEAQLQKQTGALSAFPRSSKVSAAEDEARQKEISTLRNKRQKEMENENWQAALETHNQILELDPSALRYANQGSILYRLGRLQDAVNSYKHALDLDPSLERARYDLQRLESQLEEEELLGSAAQKKDDNKDQLDKIRQERQAKIVAGDWEGALELHNQLLELEPTALRYANRGALLYRLDRFQEALQDYQKALELDPNLTKAKEDKAQLEAQLEEESLLAVSHRHAETDALSAEERAAKIRKLRDERQTHLDSKEWDKALELHEKIIEIEPTALRYVNRGSMLYRMNRLEDAIKSYRIAVEMEPNLGRAKRDLARLEEEFAKIKVQKQTTVENTEEVAQQIEKLRKQRKKLVQNEEWEQALEVQDQILALEPSALRHANRGSILYRLGRIHDAIFSYRNALDMDPSLRRAQEDMEKIRETEMDNLRILRQEKMEEEDWEGALEVHDVLVALDPMPLRYANRGSILYRMNHLSEAMASYQKALDLDPNLQKAREDLAEIQEQLQESPALTAVPAEFEEDEDDFLEGEEIEELEEQDSEEDEAIEDAAPVETGIKTPHIASLTGHSSDITQIRTTPDGKLLVSASKDDTIKIWDLQARKCLRTLKGHKDWVRTLDISPAGKKIVTGSDDWTLKIWDVQTGKCDHTFTGHSLPVIAVALAKKNRYIFSASRDKSVKVWDTKSGKQIQNLEGHSDWVTCISLLPGEDKLVSAGYDSTLRLWNILGWRCKKVLEGHKDWVEKLLITPDGKYLISASRDKVIRIWEIANERTFSLLDAHNDQITDIQLSVDGKLLISGGRDQCIHVWNVPAGDIQHTLRGQISRFVKVAITPDNSFVIATSSDNKLWAWELEKNQLVGSWEESCPITCDFTFIPESKLFVSGSRDGTIKIWDASLFVK